MIEVVEFALGLALPFAAGRLGGPSATRAVTTAALAATTFALLDTLALPSGASPIPGALGAGLGYLVVRGRLEGAAGSAVREDIGREVMRARMTRRIAVGAVSAAFAVYCILRAGPEHAGDVRAAWQIRAAIGGGLAVIALVGALFALGDSLAVTEGDAGSDGPPVDPGTGALP